MCQVTQYVMAYKVKKTQIQRILPKNFHCLKGVLLFKVEVMTDVPWLEGRDCVRVEFNTPVSNDDRRGWFNLVTWENCYITDSPNRDIPTNTAVKAVISAIRGSMGASFTVWNEKSDSPFLTLDFDRTAEFKELPLNEDNEGTFYYSKEKNKIKCYFKPVEVISERKELCNVEFNWEEAQITSVPYKYRHIPRFCSITPKEMIGGYMVKFDRTVPEVRYELIMEK